jgi:signal peptidase I
MTRSRRGGFLPLVLVAAAAACSGGGGRTFRVQSCNMAPNLLPGYHVHVESAPHQVKRGDIVYFLPPVAVRRGSSDLRVSRVVGMPGDHIEARGDKVFVNGSADREPYLPAGTPEPFLKTEDVPPGHYFLMGDNRGNSLDSRTFGAISARDIRYRSTSVDKHRKSSDIDCFDGPGAPTGRTGQG